MFGRVNFLNKKMVATLKIRSKAIHAARQWLNQNAYIEVQGPIIVPATGEWPSYLKTEVFEKKAYLAQGLHPYSQIYAASLGKIYTFAPTFRVEKTSTNHHLIEFWRIEVVQQTKLENIMRVQEKLIEHICQNLSKSSENELTILDRSTKDLEKIHAPFKKITYEEAIQKLQNQGSKIVWGETIEKEKEKNLSNMFNQPFFITEFPVNYETFFYETVKEKPELTKSADLIVPQGYGELSSGAQKITNKKELSKKMQEMKINPKDQQWYLNLIKNSKTPQSGFAIGFERLIQWICNIKDIKQTTPYPRTPENIYP